MVRPGRAGRGRGGVGVGPLPGGEGSRGEGRAPITPMRSDCGEARRWSETARSAVSATPPSPAPLLSRGPGEEGLGVERVRRSPREAPSNKIKFTNPTKPHPPQEAAETAQVEPEESDPAAQ